MVDAVAQVGVLPQMAAVEVEAARSTFVDCGAATADTLLSWREHLHRKVEAIALLEGDRARRRISLDLTPREIPWPPRPIRAGSSPDSPRRPAPSPILPHRQIVVPLTFIAKGPVRTLDVTDSAGRSLPILGRTDNGLLSAAALEAVVRAETSARWAADRWSLLHQVACGSRVDAASAAEELLATCRVSDLTRNLVNDLASNFVLYALLPAEAAKVRQVVKYSYHWDYQTADPVFYGRGGTARQLRAGLGLGEFAISINLGSPSTAASYHLEVPAPEGLICTTLRLPRGQGGHHEDIAVTPVAHAFESYSSEPDLPADVQLGVSGRGIHPGVAGAAFGTCLIFGCAVALPHALRTLRDAGGGANGLLLFGPALLLALVAGRGENTLVSNLLLPLRLTALGLSGLLFVCGASLVGQLHQPYLELLWALSTLVSGGGAIVLGIAFIKLRRRGG